MGPRRLAAWLIALGVLTGCPYAIPGLRADVGVAPSAIEGVFKPAFHATAGVSLASVLKRPRPFDVGGGYALFYPSDLDTVHGAYLDAAWLKRLDWNGEAGWMLSAGARAELLVQERRNTPHTGVGGAVRLAFERISFTETEFSNVSGSVSGVGFIAGGTRGNLSLGLVTELGVRRLPGRRFSVYGVLGATFRLPPTAGVFFFIPFPK